MTQTDQQPERFPASEFDQWAGQYDQDVNLPGFPFSRYPLVLAEVVRLAGAGAGQSVLDLGAGTGNLARKFVELGCVVWATDFSEKMIAIGRTKLPEVSFYLHDLNRPFPPVLARRFDRIVSAYVFHHFELEGKVALAERLMRDHLPAGGRLVIADVSFPTDQALDDVRRAAGEAWDEEPYWIASDALPALERRGLTAEYRQVSDCAGVYLLEKTG